MDTKMAIKCAQCGKEQRPNDSGWLSKGIIFTENFCSKKCRAEYEKDKEERKNKKK